MPTSATGTSTSSARRRGFTLVELLVVLAIAGLITAAALLSLRGGGEERLAREEIRRLERLVTLAADESVYRLVELGLEFTRDGYRFLAWDGTGWAPLEDAGVMAPHRWPAALAPSLTVNREPVPLPAAFDREQPLPQVVFLSSGEVSAFRLDLLADNRRGERLQVHITAETERSALGGAP